MQSRYIIRQINLINLLLSGTLIFFIYMLFSLFSTSVEFSLPPAEPPAETHEEIDVIETAESIAHSPDDYTIITEQNLFHPERKIITSAKESAPIVRPDFVLYGTMITEDTTIAFLDDLKAPRTSPGRGKRQWALSPGDKLSGYTLSEVSTDGAVMVSGDDRIELMVIDQSKIKGRGDASTTSRKTEAADKKEKKKASRKARTKTSSSPADYEE